MELLVAHAPTSSFADEHQPLAARGVVTASGVEGPTLGSRPHQKQRALGMEAGDRLVALADVEPWRAPGEELVLSRWWRRDIEGKNVDASCRQQRRPVAGAGSDLDDAPGRVPGR